MSYTFVLLVALATPAQATVDLTALLQPMEFYYTGGGYKDELFAYRLYLPRAATPGSPVPLVVWLHGLSQAGTGNVAQMKGLDRLIFRGPPEQTEYPFALLAVQCPADNERWSPCHNRQTQDDMVNVLVTIVEHTLKECPIDRERVTVTGLSSGGSGTWEIACRYPEYFAAIAPHGSGGVAASKATRLKDVPVWAFHSQSDEGVSIEGDRRSVKAVRDAGGTAYLTEVDASEARTAFFAGHDCWTTAFHDYQLLDWLLAQKRGQASWWNRPGSVSLAAHVRYLVKDWSWWQLAGQALVVALPIAAAWTIIQQRRRAAR